MKKLLLLAPVLALILGACIPEALQPQAEAPVADLQATVEALASTKAAQTIESLPIPTLAPPTEIPPTEVLTIEEATATLEATEAIETPAETSGDDESATPTVTLVATEAYTTTPLPPTTTATSIYPSPTSPVIINTPPPDVPRYKITLINKAGTSVGVYMEGYIEGDYYPIVAYNLARFEKAKFEIPAGYYTVIVHVGNDPMVDYVGINRDGTTITVYKDYFKIVK